jgi:hypothetical protein
MEYLHRYPAYFVFRADSSYSTIIIDSEVEKLVDGGEWPNFHGTYAIEGRKVLLTLEAAGDMELDKDSKSNDMLVSDDGNTVTMRLPGKAGGETLMAFARASSDDPRASALA